VVRRAASGAALAVGLLTVIPIRARTEPRGLSGAAAWFPAVGALVGLGAGAVRLAAEPTLGAGVAAVLTVAVLVVATGALHQDGLADCADALGARGERERRLAVMRDSSTGAFGTLALALWALLYVAALAALPRHDAIPTLVVAAALGRWAAVVHAAASPAARPEGLGAAFVPSQVGVAIATGFGAALAISLDPASCVAALAAAALVAAATTAWARDAVGGHTGDTLGATVALAEVTAALVLLGFAR
jgi:adenosylcobinamide-GDP ribazoletransferase